MPSFKTELKKRFESPRKNQERLDAYRRSIRPISEKASKFDLKRYDGQLVDIKVAQKLLQGKYNTFEERLLNELKSKDPAVGFKKRRLDTLVSEINRYDIQRLSFVKDLEKYIINLTENIISLEQDYSNIKGKLRKKITAKETMEEANIEKTINHLRKNLKLVQTVKMILDKERDPSIFLKKIKIYRDKL